MAGANRQSYFPRLQWTPNNRWAETMMGAAFSACELRSSAPFTDQGFRTFNEDCVTACRAIVLEQVV
jgi:hypothetical protein